MSHLKKPNMHSEDLNKTEVAKFWLGIRKEINGMHKDARKLPLPATRVKKIMKIDEDVKLISSEAPVLLAKASEIFMRELTLKAWHETKDHRRTTLQKNDIAAAMKKDEMYDFLVDIIPGPKTTDMTVFQIVLDDHIKQMVFTRHEPAPMKTNMASVPATRKRGKENTTPKSGRAERMF